MFYNEKYFDSYGSPPPLSITNHNNKGINSEHQIQRK